MSRPQTGLAVAIAVVSFAITLLVLRNPREASQSVTVTAGVGRPVPPAPGIASHHPNAISPPGFAPRIANSSGPAIEVPPSDEAGPPLPVMLAVSTHPAGLEGDDAENAATPNVQAGVAREVDVVNISSDLLSITVMAVNPPTGEQTLAQLLVPPNTQAHIGSESALKLEPGYAVTLRSRGYREMTTTVN